MLHYGISTNAHIGLQAQRSQSLFVSNLQQIQERRDAFFRKLLLMQWATGTAVALALSPLTYIGRRPSIHIHVYYAVFVGALITLPAVFLTLRRPGWVGTRHVVAVSQMLWSTLFIHMSGGRIETHFHIFVSLAFLAYYRDANIIVTATCVVLSDHLLRGWFFPLSIYGVRNPEWWRFLEHAMWLLFESAVLTLGIQEIRREILVSVTRQAQIEAVAQDVETIVLERTAELKTSEEQYRALVESIHAVMGQWSRDRHAFAYVGPQAEGLLECPASQWLEEGFLQARAHPDDLQKMLHAFSKLDLGTLELRLRHSNGAWIWALVHFRSVDRLVTVVLVDITEKRRTEQELGQAQKLESVGRLASGIAHEINTPVQFVTDSVTYLRDAFTALLQLVEQYRKALKTSGHSEAIMAELEAAEEEADIEYARERVPKSIERALDGLSRVAKLVKSMKAFAHPDQTSKVMADINQIIATTLTIANNEYKYVANVQTNYGKLPLIPCHVSELGQAFLNIIVNAAHAIADATPSGGAKGTISISTLERSGYVVAFIADTGGGIPESIREQIFEPFFTTKEVGRGTGQGLPISRSIVVEKHGGTLTFKSEVGVGTTFTIALPSRGLEGKATP